MFGRFPFCFNPPFTFCILLDEQNIRQFINLIRTFLATIQRHHITSFVYVRELSEICNYIVDVPRRAENLARPCFLQNGKLHIDYHEMFEITRITTLSLRSLTTSRGYCIFRCKLTRKLTFEDRCSRKLFLVALPRGRLLAT